MPANVEQMFSVRQMPWHQEGQVIADYPGSWAEARKLAGLDWEPVTGPVYTVTGINADGTEHFDPIDGWKTVTRGDTGAVLSIRDQSYQVITHEDMGLIVEAVLDQPNVKYETAGCLAGGRQVWVLALLDEPIDLPGDTSPVLPYLAITNRHDGTRACALRATAVRIVCANTFGASEMEGERHGRVFSFVHKGQWRDRLDEARAAVTGARRQYAEYKDLMARLIGVSMTAAQVDLFVREFIPDPPKGLISDRVAKNIEEARSAVRGFLASKTVEGAGVGGTAYGCVQAAGEYLDHTRKSRTWETRLNRCLLAPEPLKARAVKLALEAARA